MAVLHFFLVEIVIGFVQPSYAIVESGGQQQICAEIKSGVLRTTVTVQFSTLNGDAIGNILLLSSINTCVDLACSSLMYSTE